MLGRHTSIQLRPDLVALTLPPTFRRTVADELGLDVHDRSVATRPEVWLLRSARHVRVTHDPVATPNQGFRALGSSIFETVVNKSEAVKGTKRDKGGDLTPTEKKELTAEEKEYKSKRKQIQEKLIKFATRIPAFMYLTDFRENTLQDVITKLEPELFKAVTGLSVADFNLLVSLGVFNATHMNQAVFAFRRYEDASLSYTGIESHQGLRHYGLYDTVVAVDEVVRA